MKELSIEEKAKRYDEAIETTRKWYDSNTNDGYRGIFEDIFPELKESEDERIRKELLEHCKNQELKTELNKYIKGHFTIDTEQLDKFGIEEEDYMYSMDKSDMLALVEHFTNWQKTKDESTTEDLEDYINELSKQFPEVSFAKLSRIAVRVAKWQKEQIMAKAIDGVVTFDYYDSGDKTYGCVAHDSFCLEDFGLKDRDKVKVIVIKED